MNQSNVGSVGLCKAVVLYETIPMGKGVLHEQ